MPGLTSTPSPLDDALGNASALKLTKAAVGNIPAILQASSITANISTIAVTSNVATVVMSAPHGFTGTQTGNVIGTVGNAFDGYQTFTVTGASSFTFPITVGDQVATSQPGATAKVIQQTAILQVDSGGDTRGPLSVDLQAQRLSADQVASGDYSAILNGQDNKASGDWSVVPGGQGNTTSGDYSQACGQGNTASGKWSVALGVFNTASDDFSVAIGANNTASAPYAVAMGNENTASGNSAFAEGFTTKAIGTAAHAEGQNCEARGDASHAQGSYAVARSNSQHAESSVSWNVPGDTQFTRSVLSAQTTDDTQTELGFGGDSGSVMVLPDSSTWGYKVTILARKDDGTSAKFVRSGVITRTGATTALLGVQATDVPDVPVATNTWSITVTADNTAHSLSVKVTGASSSNINWIAVVECVELIL